jgi:hypothetical protein
MTKSLTLRLQSTLLEDLKRLAYTVGTKRGSYVTVQDVLVEMCQVLVADVKPEISMSKAS